MEKRVRSSRLETNTDTVDNEEEAVQILVPSGIPLPTIEAEPNVVQTISRDPPTSLLGMHAPQNAVEARLRMDQMIEAQREAHRAVIFFPWLVLGVLQRMRGS